ncbi:hypothetical protein M0R01_04465 [bacterium]|jgi:hypothetical protein|nr:hypothetical protein [bacterium]
MSENKTLDLNNGEEKTPGGDGQPQNNASGSENSSTEEIESQINKTLGDQSDKDDEVDLGDEEDETVVLPRKTVEKILRDKKNYKDGLLSVKDKLKGFKKPVQKNEEKPKQKSDNEPITRADLHKINSDKAIKEVCKDEVIDKNWVDIIKFYTPRRGKESTESIIADIQDARTLWEKNGGKTNNGDDGNNNDRKISADLAAEKSKPSGTKGEGKNQERKSILTKKIPVKEWYK